MTSWTTDRTSSMALAAVVGAVATLAAGPASAQSWEDCLEEAVVEADLRTCAQERAERAAAALDSAYHELADRLAPERRALLEGAQHRWRDYRDAHCDYVAAPQVGASLHRNVIDTCRARLTERRTSELIGAVGAVEGGAGTEGPTKEGEPVGSTRDDAPDG